MRTFVLLLLLGRAAKNANPGAEPPPPMPETVAQPLDAVQTRACESCRHNMELCRERMNARASAEGMQSGPGPDCVGEYMTCLNGQQLDTARCQGLN